MGDSIGELTCRTGVGGMGGGTLLGVTGVGTTMVTDWAGLTALVSNLFFREARSAAKDLCRSINGDKAAYSPSFPLSERTGERLELELYRDLLWYGGDVSFSSYGT